MDKKGQANPKNLPVEVEDIRGSLLLGPRSEFSETRRIFCYFHAQLWTAGPLFKALNFNSQTGS